MTPDLSVIVAAVDGCDDVVETLRALREQDSTEQLEVMLVANAGHPAPYAGGCEVEVEAGLPLGVVGGVEYAESRLVLGGQFVLVSDGVVEAENPKRELFGFDRTREISDKPAQQIAEAARAWGQNDDITVVTVRRTA